MKNYKELYVEMLSTRRAFEKVWAYENAKWYQKLLMKKPQRTEKTCKLLANEFCHAFNLEHEGFRSVDTWNGNHAEILMKYSENLFLPVLWLKTYMDGCYGIERYEFDANGNASNSGCPYSYSECGVGYRMDLNGMPEGTDRVYRKFDELLLEVAVFLAANNE